MCTEDEKAIIESWYLQIPLDDPDITPKELSDAVDRVEDKLPVFIPKSYSIWPKLLAASVIAGVLFIVIPLVNKRTAVQRYSNHVPQHFKPENKAILTLPSGQTILLNGNNAGLLANQGNLAIKTTSGGDLQYVVQATSNNPAGISLQNNISTPRGAQLQLKLSDGTNVWLNAASSIKYPEAFDGSSREVSITGEVYFEVAKDKTRPFRVSMGKQIVEVLGTHFNVNSYHDDGPVNKITLLEGRVKVSSGGYSVIIKPGQQAEASLSSENKIGVIPADIENVMAWRTADLQFDNENIRTILGKISRLYDMDIVYEGQLSDETFGGMVSHAQNIQELLDVIAKTCNVHIKVEGRRIMVKP